MCVSHDLNNALQSTQNWISDLMWRLRWHDREQVYRALIATLHALRDCLNPDEAVYMGAQLPALLRGFYYEGWHPTPPRHSQKSKFVSRPDPRRRSS
ncbi:DUF2267 domain-containing protein [Mesorhizobium sp. M1322]|uniref:DUF2267 domain-containing protein n=1 Tax=Mesorhizobium sp. M1322 TaxID=2957081 RepID=UPI00333BFEEE